MLAKTAIITPNESERLSTAFIHTLATRKDRRAEIVSFYGRAKTSWSILIGRLY